MLSERYEELCTMSTYASTHDGELGASGDVELRELNTCDMSRDEVLSYASLVLQQCMSECINALNEAQVARSLAEYPEKKAVHAMFVQVLKHCAVDGFAGGARRASIMKWILVLDLPNADQDLLSELVKFYEDDPNPEFSSDDILGTFLHTTKIGTRLLECAAAWAKDEETGRRITRIESFITQLLNDKPKIWDGDEPEFVRFLDLYVVPAEALAKEVCEHESVSDTGAQKTNKRLASFVSKLSDIRTDLWEFVQAEFMLYVEGGMVSVCSPRIRGART